MRSPCSAAAVTLLACTIAASAATASAQTKVPCGQTLTQPLPSRAELLIDSKPAGLQIVPTDQDELRVTCTAGTEETAGDVALRFSPQPGGGKLSIKGPELHHGNNGIQVKIEVPRRTNLTVRMFAGQITVEGVKGDKDLNIGAGQIIVSSIHTGDYRSVNASVTIGEVQASAYGAEKGGFFRSVRKENSSGDYRLQAHVTTGQIELLGNAEQNHDESKPD